MENTKIDVTIATKNNEFTIGEVIRAIKEHIPYNSIIVVDDSSDKTPQIAEMLGAKVVHVEGKIGMKRIMQARLASTEWIACIDSDVIIYSDWWKEVSAVIRGKKVVSVNGYLESDFRRIFPDYEDFTKFCAAFRFMFVKRIGSFSNVLIRRDALLMCENEIGNVHAGEDTIIGKKLLKSGFSHKVIPRTLGFHWHKNAVDQHVMAYHRAGESARANSGKMTRSIKLMKFFILMYLQLFLFSVKHRAVSSRLWYFVSLLSSLYVSGLLNLDSLRDTATRRIGKIFD
jgi:glycosyltransferase involved in cell wall biosynthesis